LAQDNERMSTTVQVGSADSMAREVAPSSYPRPLMRSVLSAGARLAEGRFEILRRLGAGGMGVVY
jgi:hypothetical protein